MRIMPRLNKCKYRKKVYRQIGQKRDGFHFGYKHIAVCLINGFNVNSAPKCKGWNCGNYKETKEKGDRK